MTRTIRARGPTALALALLAPANVPAQTQLDFDVCNQHAAAVAASPSASPRTSPGTSSGGSTMTSPGRIDANRQPNATGRISGSAGSPGTDTGTGPGGLAREDGGWATPTSDVQLRGMAPIGTTDEAYRRGYRDCMRGRGF
jgi:hypothetical protein